MFTTLAGPMTRDGADPVSGVGTAMYDGTDFRALSNGLKYRADCAKL
jgi:hypothetical protein